MFSKFSIQLKKPSFKFLKNKKKFQFNKKSIEALIKDFDYKEIVNKYKNKLNELLGKESDNTNHLSIMI